MLHAQTKYTTKCFQKDTTIQYCAFTHALAWTSVLSLCQNAGCKSQPQRDSQVWKSLIMVKQHLDVLTHEMRSSFPIAGTVSSRWNGLQVECRMWYQQVACWSKCYWNATNMQHTLLYWRQPADITRNDCVMITRNGWWNNSYNTWLVLFRQNKMSCTRHITLAARSPLDISPSVQGATNDPCPETVGCCWWGTATANIMRNDAPCSSNYHTFMWCYMKRNESTTRAYNDI